jgi:hypothetical protein
MKTIKLQIEANSTEWLDIRRTYSSVVRFCFNRFNKDKLSFKEIDKLVKTKYNLNSWLLRCAAKEAEGIYDSFKKLDNKTLVFGGKLNLIKRSQNKISKDEWNQFRLRGINIQGETIRKSNRLFNFDLTTQSLTFKPNRDKHINIKLIGIGRNRQRDLDWLQTQIGIIPITVKLTQTHCYITFDDKRAEQITKINGRTAGIDLNPNYIGFVVRDKSGKLLHKTAYDITKIEGNKQNYELVEISKEIQVISKHFGVESFGLEKLEVKTKDHLKGHGFNRLVNNKWNRKLFVTQLEKRLTRLGIKVKFVLAQYSSYVGNLTNPDLFDPIASAAEIARRANDQFTKELCVWSPVIPTAYQNLWKEDDKLGKNWARIITSIKNEKLRYRVPLDARKCAVYRFVSDKSLVKTICY